ncbi:BTAD domain-containing putative transcriptional regulator [Fodinibius saliphilus]|uniref:BTAD domain-containing putative transcriptional regulator n=1 Tax=Fodinibius saliphilus TaxID=1920650 RepID=UPI0011091939|nr:BTAD domain-containing putative transcriptional regulator [Fodinibius saliphilus]
MVNFRILGSISLQKDNEEYGHTFLNGPKKLALFTYLVLARPRGYHRRDRLIAIFWPEIGQKNARNALSNLLYNIRDALGKETIINRGTEEIAINSDLVQCDAIEFEKALDKGQFRKSVNLYKGDLLQGFHVKNTSNHFQDWLDIERNRLRKRAADGYISFSNELEENGNISHAVEMAAKAIELQPLSPKHQSSYLELLLSNDLKISAIRAYEKYKLHLEKELGVQPPDDLQVLARKLKSQYSSPKTQEVELPRAVENPQLPFPVEKSKANTADKNTRKINGGSGPTPFTSQYEKRNYWLLGIITAGILVLIAGIYTWSWQPNQQHAGVIGQDHTVAVLPFTYINAPDSIDYFSIGMTEEILTKLARIPDLSVISRTSVMQYQGQKKDIRQIARELGVNAVVEGSVQKAGNDIRITAKLINARTGHNIWTKSYDRRMKNILLVQSEVATHIANRLQAELLPTKLQNSSNQRDVNNTAYHLYLRGKYLMDMNEPSNIFNAVDYFEQSIEIDTTFAPAYSELALAFQRLGRISRFDKDVIGVDGISIENASSLAMKTSEKALSLDSTMVNAYLVQAIVSGYWYRDWIKSRSSFERALELNPSHSESLVEYGWYHLRMGNINEALIQMKKAVNLDPVSWASHHGLGYAYYCARNYENAIIELETSLKLGSLYPNTKKYLSTARLKRSQQLFNKGREAEAIALIENANTMLNEIWGHNTGWEKTIISAAMGKRTETLKSFDNESLPIAPRLYSSLLIGETEIALRLIDQNLRFNHRVFKDPIFDSIRNDIRFKNLVEKKLERKVDVL